MTDIEQCSLYEKRVKGTFPMPTQEERLAALEKNVTDLRQRTAKAIVEIEENTTIMLGVLRSQGRDIRYIYERLETIEERLDEHTALLKTVDQRLDRLETKVDAVQTSLAQILARLPEKP